MRAIKQAPLGYPAAAILVACIAFFVLPALIIYLICVPEEPVSAMIVLCGAWVMWTVYGRFAKPGKFGYWYNSLWRRAFGAGYVVNQVIFCLLCLALAVVPFVLPGAEGSG